MDAWKSLEALICEYTEGQRRIDVAIAYNRARAAAEPNRRRRYDLYCQRIQLEDMRADLAYSIDQMRRCIDGK